MILRSGQAAGSWAQHSRQPAPKHMNPPPTHPQYESRAVAKREQLAAGEERRLHDLEGRLAARERALAEQKEQLAQVREVEGRTIGLGLGGWVV